jgi:hypothetical protein
VGEILTCNEGKERIEIDNEFIREEEWSGD